MEKIVIFALKRQYDCIMRIKNGFVIREICGEKVISGEGTDCVNFNKLIRLNDSAAYLLESVGSSDFTEETMADLLLGRYDVSPEKALSDVRDMCRSLKDNGIVE